MQLAIRDYALELSRLSEAQIQEVLEEILNTAHHSEDMRPVVLSFNAKLMTALRQNEGWPKRPKRYV